MSTRRSNDGTRESDASVVIERYSPSDRRSVLALDEAVWNRERSESWFAWKYEENPFAAEPPVFVAKADGRVVGARPFMAFPLRVGETTLSALQPSDTMVHPDYRGRGIFTRMTEAAIARYAEGDHRLCFNFPNEMAWPGYRKLGWRAVGERTTHYRLQNPATVAAEKLNGGVGDSLRRVADAATGAYRTFRSRATDPTEQMTLDRRSGVAVDELAALYRRRVPSRIHAHRTPEFYRWRFSSPAWRRRTYLAGDGDGEVAGVVSRTRVADNGLRITQIAEVAPLVGGERWSAAVAALVDRVVEDHPQSDIIAAHESPIPREHLAANGFRADGKPPLSWATNRVRFAVRPLESLDGPAWEVDGRRLTEPSSWCLSFTERDTA